MIGRNAPLRRTTRLRAVRQNPRRRTWQCQFCPARNESGTRKCSACGIKRGKKAASWEAEARKFHRQVVVPEGAVCAVCGCTRALQDAHVFGRGANPNPAVKWHPANGIPLCACPEHQCHYKFDSYQLGDRGAIAVRHIGPGWYVALQTAAQTRWDRDWPGVIAKLRSVLDQRKAKEEAA